MNKKNQWLKLKKISERDIPLFQSLVRNNWPKNNHIFSKDKKIINFYYNFKNNKKINILGLYKKGKLVSAMGLIPNKNWDSKLKDDYFIAFLVKSKKLLSDSTFVFLSFVYKKIKPKFLGVCGINLNTSGKIFQRLGKIELFSHYYISNPNLKSKVSKNLISYRRKFFDSTFLELNLKIDKKFYKLPISTHNPIKSKKFFQKKYLENPFYNYFVMNFYSANKLIFFFICRKIEIKKYNTKIVRIIDFQGTIPNKVSLANVLTKYLINNKIEYIDMLCHGFSKNILENIGFLKKKNNQIIPDHFEPFTGKDAKLNFSILINKYKRNMILFKGDGDQDRPNII